MTTATMAGIRMIADSCADYLRHPLVSFIFLVDISRGKLAFVWLFNELDDTGSRHRAQKKALQEHTL